jgi:polyferredoxin
MFKRIKDFFIRITPSKRKIIQLYAALLHNANISGFITGKIHTGDSKLACLPGLNCYSCPGAVGACPLGSLQNALAESKTKLPTYILGIILLYSIILGRTICGYLCPMGLIQELLYKIKSPKLKKNKVTRVLSYFKYVLLFALVIIVPLIYGAQKMPLPAFCKYVCPSGTSLGAIFLLMNPSNNDFFSMLGSLFTWKFLLLIIFLVGSVFIFRFFCRFFCPLGAIYGLFNKLSILGVKVDKSKCTSCSACINHCKMDVKEVGDHECIQCGECRSVCHCNAISWKTLDKIIKEDDEIANEIVDSPVVDNDSIVVKKSRKISKKAFNIISTVIATLVLVGVILAINIKPKLYEINDVCDELNITLFEQYEFDIKTDDKNTLLYFYDTLYESD